MQGKLVILAVVVLLVSMVLLGVSDSKASVANAGASDVVVADTEADSNEAQEEDLPSATATITITWRVAASD